LPLRAPFLIGWAGGPKADRLSGASENAVLREAMKSLGTIFGRVPESELAGFFMHDWQADPFARGAYSYVAVGGEGAREALRAPLSETLYFAGEAADAEGEAGTVAGALQTGTRAARELLAGESR
jgi:monoamine oxidase